MGKAPEIKQSLARRRTRKWELDTSNLTVTPVPEREEDEERKDEPAAAPQTIPVPSYTFD